MKKLWNGSWRLCREWTKIVFWAFVAIMVIRGTLHWMASWAPPHMQTRTVPTADGGKIIVDPIDGKNYYFPPEPPPSGTKLESVEKAEPAPKRAENGEGRRQRFPDLPK